MTIYYEDRHLVVCEKPRGVPSQPDPSGKADMTALLREACGGEIFCVHRLDTATEGVMVYAKDPKTAGRLSASLQEDAAVKQYLCIACAQGLGSGSMKDLLFHDKRRNKSFVVDRMRNGVKTALLDYETVSEAEGRSLVRVTLHTGRTHQIRVQFASRKAPLLGDGKYGSRDNSPLALRCIRLAFSHPYTKKPVDITALPENGWFSFPADAMK